MWNEKTITWAAGVLERALVPTTEEISITWLTRMYAHFHMQESRKDSIKIADIAGDLANEGASAMAVMEICHLTWRAGSSENPYPPVSGELCNRILQRTDFYKTLWKRLKVMQEKMKGKK